MRLLALGVVLAVGICLGLVFVGGWGASGPPAPTEPEAEARLGRFPLSQFYLEHDRFLAATDPRVVSAEQADWLRADDEVFGVVLGGQARAYPVPMISYHHVVNDVVRGIPVAVTY